MIAPWLIYASALAALFAAAALGLTRIAQLRRGSQRGIWFVAIVATMLVPLIGDLFFAPLRMTHVSTSVPHSTSPLPIDAMVLLLWGAASLVMMMRLANTLFALHRSRRGWREGLIDGTPVLFATDTGPALIGLTHPRAVIPLWALELDANDRALILLHEHEHALAGDPRLLAVGAASLALMPLNPALWWMVRRLRLAIEMDCDARVLQSGVDAHRYARLLLAVGERMSRTTFAWATALVEPRSLLEQRIRLMLTPAHFRRPKFAIAGLGIAAAIALILACSTPMPTQVQNTKAADAITPANTTAEVAQHFDRKTPRLGDTVYSTVMHNGKPETVSVLYRIGTAEEPSISEHPAGNPNEPGSDSVRSGRLVLHWKKVSEFGRPTRWAIQSTEQVTTKRP